MVDALVLAGGSAKELAPVPTKGLVPINGRPMVEYVVDALLKCEDIGRICVVLPVDYSFNNPVDGLEVLVANGSLLEVAKAGIDHLGTENHILGLSGDTPAITPEAISDFLKRCSSARKADIYYPVVNYGQPEKQFPGIKRTYFRLREGRFTGGNMLFINPTFIKKNIGLLEQMFGLRKEPAKMARILGLSFLIRFALGLLSVRQIEERAGRITQATCVGIITPYAEIGVDVDKESDLQLVSAILAGGIDG